MRSFAYRIASALLLTASVAFLSRPVCGQQSVADPVDARSQPEQDSPPTGTVDELPLAPAHTGDVIDLLSGELDQHWQVFSSDPVTEANLVWRSVKDSPDSECVLICSGKPKGFLFTKDPVTDFELTLEWKYPTDENGNSGVLVYTQNEPRIWPTAIQVQLHQPKAGSIFPSGDATSDNTHELESDLARPVNSWNECRIVSRSGRLSVEINGKKAGEISGAMPSGGSIALQCEGSEVHFRRILIKKLMPESHGDATDPGAIPARTEPTEPMPPRSKAEARHRRRDIRQGRYHLTRIAAEHSLLVTEECVAGPTVDGQSCRSTAEFADVGRSHRDKSGCKVD